MRFDETTRTIIDGRTAGFCKLITDGETATILGCHVVGERAVEIVQVVSIAIAARLRVQELARIPLSFPTYAGIIGRAAYRAATELGRQLDWRGPEVSEADTSSPGIKRDPHRPAQTVDHPRRSSRSRPQRSRRS